MQKSDWQLWINRSQAEQCQIWKNIFRMLKSDWKGWDCMCAWHQMEAGLRNAKVLRRVRGRGDQNWKVWTQKRWEAIAYTWTRTFHPEVWVKSTAGLSSKWRTDSSPLSNLFHGVYPFPNSWASTPCERPCGNADLNPPWDGPSSDACQRLYTTLRTKLTDG